jgi:mannose-6-phosphate isomerase-like protein (cupin superfamily)
MKGSLKLAEGISTIQQLTQVNADSRRIIFEVNGPDYSVQLFEVLSDEPLGGHVHTRKREIFTIIEGGGEYSWCEADADGVQLSVVVTTEVYPREVIEVRPGVAHQFRLQPGSILHCFSSAPFNPLDKDMTVVNAF